MKILQLLALSSAALGQFVKAKPVEKRLVDLESTTLALDRTAETLNSGRLALHLTRVDDLLDDQDDNRLLLERVTHIGLTIQLDVESGSLSVNGQTLPMLLPEGEGIAVEVVKAEAYAMPSDLPAAFYEPENADALASSLSVGIASVSVRLDSEIVPVEPLQTVNSEGEPIEIPYVAGVTMRKLGLFVTIDEIEGTSFEHSRTVYAPILQLLVTAQSVDGIHQVKQISTLSVGGQPVVAEAAHSPDFLPDVAGFLPPIEPAKVKEEVEQLWNGMKAPASGLWGALESIFGQPKYEQPEVAKKGAFHPGRKGLALGQNAPSFDQSEQESTRHGKHHGHCFWKKFSNGFLFIFAAIGYAFTQTTFGVVILFGVIGALSFHVARRLKQRCTRAQHETLPQYDGDIEYTDEKPPTYSSPESAVQQTNLTIFDADAPDEKA